MAPKVDQAGSVVDDDARHWIVGPLTCRSTESRDWLRSAAARAGEISSSPTARKPRRLKRRGFSKAANPWCGWIEPPRVFRRVVWLSPDSSRAA